MRIARHALLVLALLAVAAGAHAQRTAPLVDHDFLSVETSSGQPVSADLVRQAIGSAARAQKWELSDVPGERKVLATHRHGPDDRHVVVVEISYAAGTYSIRYSSSRQMNYSARDGMPVIHPSYNGMVSQLAGSIRRELLKL